MSIPPHFSFSAMCLWMAVTWYAGYFRQPHSHCRLHEPMLPLPLAGFHFWVWFALPTEITEQRAQRALASLLALVVPKQIQAFFKSVQ